MWYEFKKYILGIILCSLYITMFLGTPIFVIVAFYKLFVLDINIINLFYTLLQVYMSVFILYMLFSIILVLMYLLYKDMFDKLHKLKNNAKENKDKIDIFLLILPDIKLLTCTYILDKGL